MKAISFVFAILESIIGVGGIVLLINTVSADANALKALIACVMFMVGSVLAAGSWVRALNIPIKPDTKNTTV